ncbi:MAG: hypothetical protein LUE99_18525 [Bacteroides sp.]|nr:hypothetical protein [Bacteroides sp.]
MKRITTLLMLTILVVTTGFAKSKQKDLSGIIAVRGELKKECQNAPAGTPVIIRQIVEINDPAKYSKDIYYAVEINGL